MPVTSSYIGQAYPPFKTTGPSVAPFSPTLANLIRHIPAQSALLSSGKSTKTLQCHAMSLSGWNRERIKYIRWWSHDKVLFEFIYLKILIQFDSYCLRKHYPRKLWPPVAALLAESFYSAKPIKPIVQLGAKQRRTKRPQTHHVLNTSNYIQLYPTISNYHVLICSVSLSPSLLVVPAPWPTELCPKICTDYFCQLTHAQSPLRSPT